MVWVVDCKIQIMQIKEVVEKVSHRSELFSFFKKFFGWHESFSWGHGYHCFGLLMISDLGFKARMDPWQLSLFDPCTRRCVHKHWWRFGAEPMTVCAAGTVLYTTRPFRLGVNLRTLFTTEQLCYQQSCYVTFLFCHWQSSFCIIQNILPNPTSIEGEEQHKKNCPYPGLNPQLPDHQSHALPTVLARNLLGRRFLKWALFHAPLHMLDFVHL